MTSEQAKQVLEQGKKVRAVKWWLHEFIFKKDSRIFFNHEMDDEEVDESIFEDHKDEDWEEWEEGE